MAGKRNQSRATSPASGSFSDDGSGGGGSSTTTNNNKEQDRFLPIANVSRIMKNSLPANAKISKEAKESVQQCVSEFISFVTGEASDKCHREKRKTVNGDDLLWAMTTLGFDSYVAPLKVYLGKYRETEEDKVGSSATSDGCSQHQQLESSVAIVSANNNYVSSGGDGRYFVGGDHHQQLYRYGAGDGGGGDRMMNGGPVFSERRPVYQGLDLQGGYDIGPAAVYTLGVGVHPHQATAVSAAGLLGYGDGGGRAMAHQFN